jgi:hypothetical protein
MTRLQQELITYNSMLAEVFLRFKKKDEILVGGPAEAVLFAFSIRDQAQVWMSGARPCLGLERPAVVAD